MRPLHGLRIVFGGALAIAITNGEIDLSFGIAAGGLAAQSVQLSLIVG